MRQYFVTFIGEVPAELKDIIAYTPKLATGFVIVDTDKSIRQLMNITGVKHVERADTGKLCLAN